MKCLSRPKPRIPTHAGSDVGSRLSEMSRQVFVPFGADWRYRHEDPPGCDDWTSALYDDGAWASGVAPLGYNTNETGARIYPGASFKRRPSTAQLRHTFAIGPDAPIASRITVAVHRNTGLRVYLNGDLVAWDGVPRSGSPGDGAPAASTSSDTTRFPLQFSIAGRCLRLGQNVVAVELLHAQRAYSSLTFDLALANGDAPLARTKFAASVTSPIPEPIARGRLAPDFDWLDAFSGRARSLREYFGEPFVLQFSGAECRPCWKKLPVIRRWADAGLACLSISSWGTVEDMLATARRHVELLTGIAVGAEVKAYDAYQTACYTKYGIFNGSILVGADREVLGVATGFTLDEFLPEVRVMDGILRGAGYAFPDIPRDIGVVGGPEDWRVVTSAPLER